MTHIWMKRLIKYKLLELIMFSYEIGNILCNLFVFVTSKLQNQLCYYQNINFPLQSFNDIIQNV